MTLSNPHSRSPKQVKPLNGQQGSSTQVFQLSNGRFREGEVGKLHRVGDWVPP